MKFKPLVLIQKRAGGFFLPALLSLLVLWIVISSHQPGTWLSGWDTLHPEFNFRLAFERLFFGVFRYEQGLGAVTAHAHISDLPRVAVMALGSLVLPLSLLRYAFISLCLLTGVLGAFFFIRKILLPTTRNGEIFAFLGALFYLLNLTTLQQFYVPFEMFTVQYAALPWLWYFATKYMFHPQRKNLVIFGAITLLSTPMAYAPVLWIAYFLSLVLYLSAFWKTHLKNLITLVCLTLVINSFWLAPSAYFVLSGNAGFVPEAKINKIFSQEAFAYNKSYGTLVDTLTFRNFLLDWQSFDGQENFDYLLSGWRGHLGSPGIQTISYLLAGVSVLGMVGAIWKRHPLALGLIMPSVLAIIFLINQNPPFDWVFTIFRDRVPLFNEALRFPYTKFAILFTFAMACFFALGQRLIQSLVQRFVLRNRIKLGHGVWIAVVQAVVFSLLLLVYMKPALTGDFISKKMQVNIPGQYFELFDWFNSQPDGRIAEFPIHSFWGWIYYDWGFQGAQFISFGIKQPLLDRDYDRWNEGNEQYYREITYAVYSQNLKLLTQVLEKYNIRYLMVDRSVLAPGSNQDDKSLFYDETESLLASSPDISLVKKFGTVSVYQFKPGISDSQFFTTPESFTSVAGESGPRDVDWLYDRFGNYFFGGKMAPSVFTPFDFLADNQNILNSDLVSVADGNIKLWTKNLPGTALLSGRTYLEDELSLPVDLYSKKEGGNLLIKLTPKFFQTPEGSEPVSLFYQVSDFNLKPGEGFLVNAGSSQTLKISREPEAGEFVYQGTLFLSTNTFNNLSFYQNDLENIQTGSNLAGTISRQTLQICSPPEGSQTVEAASLEGGGLRLSAKNAQACVRIPLNQVFQKSSLSGYESLAEVSFKIASGSNSFGHYCIFDQTLGRCLREQKFISEGSAQEFIPLNQANIDRLELVFYLDALGSEKEDISYFDLSFNINNPGAFITISPDDLKKALADYSVKLDQGSVLQAGELQSLSYSPDFLGQGGKARSCGTILPKEFTRKVNSEQGFIEYSSLSGSSCDFFTFPNLLHNIGYLLLVESENISGLPFRICVANPLTKRCDLSVALPEKIGFNSQVFLLPPTNDGGAGYNVHFDNYSVGRIQSTNRLKQVKVLPFPYYWISKMQFTPGSDNLRQNSALSINSVQQIFPGAYRVETEAPKGSRGLLTLNRSFDNGWWMSGGEHVKVNGWANGWMVEGEKRQSWVIFWPQALQFLGLGFLISLGLFGVFRKGKFAGKLTGFLKATRRRFDVL